MEGQLFLETNAPDLPPQHKPAPLNGGITHVNVERGSSLRPHREWPFPPTDPFSHFLVMVLGLSIPGLQLPAL